MSPHPAPSITALLRPCQHQDTSVKAPPQSSPSPTTPPRTSSTHNATMQHHRRRYSPSRLVVR
ncbi:pollen-specific leucine-rich repeat extensin-like protein 3 [Iris pallida]|uniref:Pollen-specific leucine-rich repeat extensin-like protein 3 n=1 Tax=Iris pallida TaxID=29817 RepID=A0AAX6GBC4_IRIPA|nr:pollen-specific leucine-rich repeat extensin-like protein 3 [Iris pallida]